MKKYFIYFSLLFFLTSCEILLKPTKDNEIYHEGDVEEVPTVKDTTVFTKDTLKIIVKDSLDQIYPYTFKKKYKVAYLLPFFTEHDPDEDKAKAKLSGISQDFFFGAQEALDTLKSCGKDFDIYVFDTKNDTSVTKEIITKLKFIKPDLIIGPLFTKNLKLVADYAHSQKINVISPFAYIKRQLDQNPYFILANPGPEIYGNLAAKLITKKFKGYHLTIIRNYEPDTRKMTNAFKEAIDTSNFLSFNEYAIPESEWSRLSSKISDLKKFDNVIFVPSDNEVFVSTLFSSLRRKDDLEITLVGLTDWLQFKTFEGRLMERYNTFLLSPYYFDISDEKTIKLVKEYRKKYHVEPNDYALLGYDLTILYGTMLETYGKYFQRNWYDHKIDLIQSDFIFSPDSARAGWQNHYLHVLRVKDMQLKKVND